MATEETPLMINAPVGDFAKANHKMLTTLLGWIQAALLVLFIFGTTYTSKDYSPSEYIVFRDVMVMLLLGFGFLMTFLAKYGLGAVGLTMMLTAIAVQLNVFVELFCRFIYGIEEDTAFPLPLKVPTFIDGEFAAATLLISYGAIIGYVRVWKSFCLPSNQPTAEQGENLTILSLCSLLFNKRTGVLLRSSSSSWLSASPSSTRSTK